MSDVRSVVVAGSRFGQFYAAGVAADPRFVLRGILGQGSRRSRALAERLGVETWCEVEALPDDVRLACVAVGGAARGEQGPALAEALMARGIDVLIEHPLLPREWQDLLRSAERLGRRCLLNTFYPQLPAVARFIGWATSCIAGAASATWTRPAGCKSVSPPWTSSPRCWRALAPGRWSRPRTTCRRCAGCPWCWRKCR